MTGTLYVTGCAHVLVIALTAAAPAFAQGGRGCQGMMGDCANAADMQLFHQLFAHRAEITRSVVERADGIETTTESKNPEVTRLLQAHWNSVPAASNRRVRAVRRGRSQACKG